MTRITGLGWTGLGWPLLALAACLLALSVVGAVWITHFDDANVGFVMLLQAAPYALAAWLVVSGRAEGANSGRPIDDHPRRRSHKMPYRHRQSGPFIL